MIGIIVVVVVSLILGFIAWKLVPWGVERLGVVDGLSIVNKIMIFLCFLFAIFLLWIGMPAFVGTVKFFLFGQSFSNLFRWWIFKESAQFLGDCLLYTAAFLLWLAINFAELYPRIVRGNRDALESILSEHRASKKRAKLDPDDDLQERLIKHQIRSSGKFSMVDAYIVCGIGFALDTVIAVCNNPVVQNNSVLMRLVKLGSVSGSTSQQIVILGLLICGMTINAMVFDKFNRSEQQTPTKAKAPKPQPQP